MPLPQHYQGIKIIDFLGQYIKIPYALSIRLCVARDLPLNFDVVKHILGAIDLRYNIGKTITSIQYLYVLQYSTGLFICAA